MSGVTFVEKICSVLRQSTVAKSAVVLGHEYDEITKRVELDEVAVIRNREYERGMLSSIQTGVQHIMGEDYDALLLWPVDFPVVTTGIVDRITDRFHDEPHSDVVVPTVKGDRGHPALFAASTFDALLDAPPDRGAKAVVYADGTDVSEVEVDDKRIHVDIDTPEEYWTAVKEYTAR